MTRVNKARFTVSKRSRELAPVASSSGHALIGSDLVGIVVGWNKGAQDLYAYTAKEMIGQPIAVVIPERLHEDSFQSLLDICAGSLLRNETDLKHEEGILVQLSLVFSPVRNSKGDIIGASTIAPDITARMNAGDSRERLAALVESSDDAIIGESLDGTITTWNSGAERLFGYSSSAAVGKPIQMLLPLERANEESAILARIKNGERIDHFETTRIRKDGERVDVSVTISPIMDRGGVIVGASKIARDIGERKRAEAVQERLAAVLESSDDAIIGKSLDGTINTWNRGAENLFGYSASEAVGKPIHMLLPPERANEELDMLTRINKGERISHFETVRVQKDGKRIDVSVTISPIRDSSGAIIGSLKIARDISERKYVEEELRKAEERFGKAFRSNPLAVSISTLAEGRYLDVNDAFLKILGCTREGVIGRTASGLNFWALPAQHKEMLRLLGENVRVMELRMQYKTSIGELREAEVSAELIELEGQPCVLAITRDVTETLRSEAQFRQAQKMEAVGRLAGGVAHDFNNMLSVIIGYSDLSVDMVAADSPLKKYLAQIKKASERAALLTRQLLAFSRKQVIFPRILDLNEVVENLFTMLTRMIGEDVSLSFRPTVPIDSIKADPGQIEQILMNLVVNARDAIRSGGEIIIATGHAELDEHYVSQNVGSHSGQHVVLAVSDTGCGMGDDIISKIFEPFFTTKSLGQGTGLGLSTVYGIVSQSEGSISVDSRPGEGTTFKIYFPRVAARAEHLGESQDVKEPPLGSETILVVDDDDAVRKVTASLLRNGGYRIIEANSAEEAFAILTGSGPGIDLLLTDLVMFGQSGLELFEKAKLLRPRLRSLFMSGYTRDLVDLEPGLISERAFLAKPFARVPLLRKVYAVLHSE